jgi:hypothetical protein
VSLFNFEHSYRDGFHQYVTAGEVALDAVWPGLWEMQYPSDASLNPFLRFGINNGDGERLAVWRALSWAASAGLERFVIPNYYGDDSATALGIDPRTVDHVDWDYDIDVADPDAAFGDADRGFVKARHVVPLRPEPTSWERSTSGKARVIPLGRLSQLLALGPVVSEATSHITLFGLAAADRLPDLLQVLRGRRKPELADVLDVAKVMVDTAIDHDGFGRSYLVIRSKTELEKLDAIVAGFEQRFEAFSVRSSSINSFEDFGAAVETLLDVGSQPRAGGFDQ